MTLSVHTLKKHLSQVLIKDQFKFSRRLANNSKIKDEEKAQLNLVKIACDIQASMDKRQRRFDNLPEINYPDLPVSDKKDEIAKAILDNQVVISLVKQAQEKPHKYLKYV